jgi:transposase InsO family protein
MRHRAFDVFASRIVGWRVAGTMSTALVINALEPLSSVRADWQRAAARV